MSSNIPDIGTGIPENSVSIFNQSNAAEDFPVLKAFQQYIDAEHAKARRRLITMGIFFSLIIGAIIAVFVTLLIGISQRNQALNDRLVDFAMREHDRKINQPAAVQPAPQQDSSLVLLTTKIDELQRQIRENAAKAETSASADNNSTAKMVAKPTDSPAVKTQEAHEIARLKKLLEIERERVAIEKERQRQAEIELYRRQHYPELYNRPSPSTDDKVAEKKQEVKKPKAKANTQDVDKEIDELIEELNDDDAISYFDEDEEASEDTPPSAKPKRNYSIPVDIKGSSSSWLIPAND